MIISIQRNKLAQGFFKGFLGQANGSNLEWEFKTE